MGEFLKAHRQAVEPDVKVLGEYARLPCRIGKHVTQEEMAEALDVSRTWYALLEANHAHASATLLDRLASVFSLDASERLALFAVAIPQLGGENGVTPPMTILEALPAAGPAALALAIGSPSEIERTARQLSHFRERFLGSDTAVPIGGARPRILNSWMRSRAAGVDAARRSAPWAVSCDAQLQELRARNERLMRAAQPVVVYLADQLSGSGYAVILTDREGRILELSGDLDIRRRLARLELQTGGHWSEAAAGTNAIGTVLADGRPLQLMAAEHFCDGWQDLTCTAAPVRAPGTLEIVGALDITGGYKLIRSHLLALIMQCALEIEEALAFDLTVGPN
jgi:transcriptional regulator with XRE-family HTH domain